MKRFFVAGAAAVLSAPFAADADPAEAYADSASGSWTSIEQSTDPGYDWVESEVVRIWPDRDDGVWLYQENTIMGESPDATPSADVKLTPYFQVVIQLRDLGDGELHSTTWRVSDRQAALGAWRPGANAMAPNVLGAVACMGHLQRVGDGFWQGHAECPNGYKGGVKVDSRSLRAPGMHVNWDRGFDRDGQLVWGPASGGYIFKRKED